MQRLLSRRNLEREREALECIYICSLSVAQSLNLSANFYFYTCARDRRARSARQQHIGRVRIERILIKKLAVCRSVAQFNERARRNDGLVSEELFRISFHRLRAERSLTTTAVLLVLH